MTSAVPAEHDGATLAAYLRALLPGRSWGEVRKLAESRRVRVNGELCLDAARRLHAGEAVEVLEHSAPRMRQPEEVTLRYLDGHVVVAEKPAGMATVRYGTEHSWDERRKMLTPALEDVMRRLITAREPKRHKGPLPPLRAVHRIDKETSGLVVFARTVTAERGLGRQFHDHTVHRRYLAVVPGVVDSQTIKTHLVRDRGDGRRGSGPAGQGKHAVTHVEAAERLPGYTVLWCRLETGRTHQIRIHLAELGHPICGEKVYRGEADRSGAPRLMLHAAELGFTQPVTGESLRWSMPPPADMRGFLDRLRPAAPAFS
jgi:23S rRNA pseudouridine1911/1915/1917 synthase